MARFIMMIGPSASGKSTFANNLSKYRGWRVISSDGLRKELYGDEAIQGDNKVLFSQIHKMILEMLERDEIFVTASKDYKTNLLEVEAYKKQRNSLIATTILENLNLSCV